MSKFCPCIDRKGYCENMYSPYFLCRCPIPYNEWCPTGCNNPEIEEDEEDT